MPMVRKYQAQVVSISNPVNRIFTVVLESLGNPFKYQPGQFLHLALDEYDPTEQWPDSRCFSMQSSPTEKFIKISYSVKGRFTSRMQEELQQGKRVTLKLPFGDLFTQPHNKVNTVFIAGGTGITPFLSLFTNQVFKQYINPRIYLGFRNVKFNIYQEDLGSLKSTLLNIFYEDIEGRLDINQIFLENGTNANYFISGPPQMIKSFKQALIEFGVRLDSILTDDWE